MKKTNTLTAILGATLAGVVSLGMPNRAYGQEAMTKIGMHDALKPYPHVHAIIDASLDANERTRIANEEREKLLEEMKAQQEKMLTKQQETLENRTRQNNNNNSGGYARNTMMRVPNFFTCNYWKDFNNDGIPDDNEFVGVKKRFRKGETLRIIGITTRGGQGRLVVNGPNGNSLHDTEFSIEGPRSLGTKDSDWNWVEPILNKGGIGNYSAVWYLDRKFIGSSEFEVYEDNADSPANNSQGPRNAALNQDYRAFACNEIVVEPKSTRFEGKGRIEYNNDEKITFVLAAYNHQGSVINYKFYVGTNSEPSIARSSVLTENEQAVGVKFNNPIPGKYRVDWFADGSVEPIRRTEIIVKDKESENKK